MQQQAIRVDGLYLPTGEDLIQTRRCRSKEMAKTLRTRTAIRWYRRCAATRVWELSRRSASRHSGPFECLTTARTVAL